MRRLASAWLVAIIVGGCIIEPSPPPTASASLTQRVQLDAEHSVAVRHLVFEMSPPARDTDVRLVINAHRFLTENTGAFADGVTLSVRSDDATTTLAGSPGDARPGAIVSLTGLCAHGCKSGVMVVVRAGDGRPVDDIAIEAELRASGRTSDQTPLGTSLSLRSDDANTFDGIPTAVTARVARMVTVNAASPTAHVDLALHVDAGLLADPLAYPLVGSVSLRVTGVGISHDQLWNHVGSPIGRVTVNGVEASLAPESAAYDIDWLRLCTPGKACDIAIGVDIDDATLTRIAQVAAALANHTAPPPPEFKLTIDTVARLESFEGSLPSDGLSLEVQER